MRWITLSVLTVALAAVASAADAPAKAKLLGVRKIWDRAPHNAFTDLIRLKGRWLCVFREGAGHVSHDGKVRVISSSDGEKWQSAALLTSPCELPDLRDAKIVAAPDGRLMLTAAAASRKTKPSRHQTYAWFSADGVDWGKPSPIGQPDFWLWRPAWRGKTCYGVGYATGGGGRLVRLYRGGDGRKFDVLVEKLFEKGSPNEASLAFEPDGTCRCLLRRDGRPNSAQLGTAKLPYTKWTWQDLGKQVGGPALLRLPDGRWIAAGRRYDGRVRTSLMWLDVQKGALREFLALPSGGDTSYPGLVLDDGLLWVSYYASHEGRTSIYLARVSLPLTRPIK